MVRMAPNLQGIGGFATRAAPGRSPSSALIRMLVPLSVLITLRDAAAGECHEFAGSDSITRALEHARAQDGLNRLGASWEGLSEEARASALPLIRRILALQHADELYPAT